MAVSLYTGHVGSGKSYEVVRSVILPALRTGRTVVANIEGLNHAAIVEWLDGEGCKSPGDLIVVDKLEVRRADFFPVRQGDGSYVPSAWVPLGALVVIDECPFYWGTDKSILPNHLAFFREHRHICAADGTSCDLVVVSQTTDSVHRSLKGLVEFSVDCRKLTALGLNTKYTAVTYEGAKRTKRYVMGRETRTYDKRIFPLYRSFAVENGKIVRTDNRFTIWRSRWFWGLFALAPFVLVAAVVFLWRNTFGRHEVASSPASVITPASVAAEVAARGPLGSRVVGPQSSPVVPDSSGASLGIDPAPNVKFSEWSIAGQMTLSGHGFAVLRRPGFPLRYLEISKCELSLGRPVYCLFGGEYFRPESGGDAPGAGPAPSTWAVDRAAAKAAKK